MHEGGGGGGVNVFANPMAAEFNIYVLSLCRCPWPSLNCFIFVQDFHGAFALDYLVPDIRPRQAFSRMAPAFSAMGPLGVPIDLFEAETLYEFNSVLVFLGLRTLEIIPTLPSLFISK